MSDDDHSADTTPPALDAEGINNALIVNSGVGSDGPHADGGGGNDGSGGGGGAVNGANAGGGNAGGAGGGAAASASDASASDSDGGNDDEATEPFAGVHEVLAAMRMHNEQLDRITRLFQHQAHVTDNLQMAMASLAASSGASNLSIQSLAQQPQDLQNAISQVVRSQADRDEQRRADEVLRKAATLAPTDKPLVDRLAAAGATTRPADAVELLDAVRAHLALLADGGAARRTRLVALLETTRPRAASQVRTWAQAALEGDALNTGAVWRCDLLTALGVDTPSITWFAPTHENETVRDYLQRSRLPMVVDMVAAATAQRVTPVGDAYAHLATIRRTTTSMATALIEAAVRRDPLSAPLLEALRQDDALATLAEDSQGAGTTRLGKTRAWHTDSGVKKPAQPYALAASASEAAAGTPPPRLARRHLALAHAGATAAPVWVDAHLDSCGTHVIIRRDLLERLPGSAVVIPSERVAPLTQVVLADGSISKPHEPIFPVLLDVSLPAFGPEPRQIVAFVAETSAFPLIVGTQGMQQMGGASIQISARAGAAPVVALGSELHAVNPKSNTTTATAPPPPTTPPAVPEPPSTAAAPAKAARPVPASSSTPTDHPRQIVKDELSSVMLMFDGMAVELFGRDIADENGHNLTEGQMEAARLIAERHLAGALDASDVEQATSCLYAPQLDKAGFDPALDRAPTPAAEYEKKKFKYSSGLEKMNKIIDEVPDMPAKFKQYLKEGVAKSGATLVSDEAPPVPIGPVRGPGSVFYMRIRAGADWSNTFQGYRPLPADKAAALKEVKETWLRLGIIEPVRPGQSRVVSQPLVVPKYDLDGVVVGHRVAVDLRRVNRLIEPDHYSPIPMAEMLRWAARDCWRATVSDMKSLFNQFSVAPSQRYLTTVMLGPGEYYRFVGAPFGLSTILAWAQRFMDATFSAEHIKTFVDDSMVKHCRRGDWQAACDEVLGFLKRARDVNMAINVDKMQLIVPVPHLLGHDIDLAASSFRPRQSRQDALRDWIKPTTNETLRSFLACGAAWASYLPGWQMVAPILSKLVRPNQPLQWTAEGDAAFEMAKTLIADMRTKVLQSADAQTYIYTDGNRSGLSWAVAQQIDGRLQLIDAGGRSTAPFEKRLHVVELEFLAGRECMKQAQHLVLGLRRPARWRTDSKALINIRNQTALPDSDAIRLFLIEMTYGPWANIECEHVPGPDNPVDSIARQWDALPDGRRLPLALLRAHLDSPPQPAATLAVRVDSAAPAAADTPLLASPASASVDEKGEQEPRGARETPTAAPAQTAQPEDDSVAEEPPQHQPRSPGAPELPAAPLVTPEIIDAVTTAIAGDSELARIADNESFRWGLATFRDDSPTAKALRDAAQGRFSKKHKQFSKLHISRDEVGRIFIERSDKSRVLYVPAELVDPLIWSVHTSMADGGAHRKTDYIVDIISARFHVPDLRNRVAKLLAGCPVCQQTQRRAPDGLLGSDDRIKRRFGAVHIDVVQFDGDQPFALTMIDRVTGAFEYMPLTHHNADEVEEAFRLGWIARWGVPDLVVADQAKELIGKKMSALAVQTGFKLDPVPSRTPQANGLIERANQTFKAAVRALTPAGGDWRAHAPQARFSMWCAISATRKFSPFQLSIGEQPKRRVDQLAASSQGTSAHEQQQLPADQSQINNATARMAAQANDNRKAVHTKAAQRVERDAKKTLKISVGDVVYLENNGKVLDSKFDNMFRRTGPFSVVAVEPQRLRARLARWDTRAPVAGWVSYHRITPAIGFTPNGKAPLAKSDKLFAKCY